MILYKSSKTIWLKALTCILLILLLIPNNSLTGTAKKVTDAKPPTAPTNLVSTSITQSSVALKWSASADNVKVVSYLIYKGSTYLTSTTSTSFTVSNLTASTPYTFYVKAKDATGNISPSSNILSVTTSSSPTLSIPTSSSPTSSIPTSSSPTSSTLTSSSPTSSSPTLRHRLLRHRLHQQQHHHHRFRQQRLLPLHRQRLLPDITEVGQPTAGILHFKFLHQK